MIKNEKQQIIGLVQDVDDNLFTPWLLSAYKYLENENTSLILVGGSELYKTAAKQLDIKNITFKHLSQNLSDSEKEISVFDVFLHGSMTGESDTKFIDLAQKFGKPIVSHFAKENNKHVAVIGQGGVVHGHYHSYIFEICNLLSHDLYRKWRGEKSRKEYDNRIEKIKISTDPWLLDWME